MRCKTPVAFGEDLIVKSGDIHFDLRQRYVDRVVRELKIGNNVVVQQAKGEGCLVSILLFIISICLCYLSGWLGFFGMVASVVSYPLAVANLVKKKSLENAERIQMMQIVLPKVCNSEGESAYCKAFISVGNINTLEQSQTMNTVRSLNDLLDNYNSLEQQRRLLRKIIGDQSSARITSGIHKAKNVIRDNNDDLTQKANKKSLSILNTQLSNIEVIETSINRIESQQDVVINALNSIPITLGRAQAASLTLKSPDIDRITLVAHEINQETKAVEMAVQEIMALSIQV